MTRYSGRGHRLSVRAVAVAAALTLLAGCATAIAGSPRRGADPVATPSSAPPITAPTDPPPTVSTGGGGTPTPSPPSPPASSPPPSRPETPTGGPSTSAPPAGPTVGAPGAGDPYYPTAGNGGYQVDAYAIVLTYLPTENRLDATATITGTVTASQALGRFNLDLQPELTVATVTVNGTTADFAQQDAELVITPASDLEPASGIKVVVTYSGNPGMIAGGTSGLADGGWYRTADGGALAAGEPFSASAWYPVNEHPSDTAAFSVTATVPNGWEVISNGIRFDGALPMPPDGMHSVRFDEKTPIASYLTTILIGKLTFTTGTYGSTPILNAFTAMGSNKKPLAQQTSRVLTVLSKHFGPFPFSSYGGIYTGEALRFALETATRPVYANWVDLDTVVHETAHQWFGDHVTIERWSDICINECFASYAPWLYHADVDGADLDAEWKAQMRQVADEPGFWSVPLVDMGAGNEFSSVYDRGPLAVHALRHEMGETAFATLLLEWNSTFGGKNATFADLQSYASKLAGRDLTAFFDAWFRGTTVPPPPFRTPPGLG